MLRTWAALLAGAVLLAGCARDGGEAGAGATPLPGTADRCVEEPRETPGLEGAVSCTLQARIVTEVAGDESFENEGEYYVAVNEFFEGVLPDSAWFANFGMGIPVDFADRMKFRVGFDIAPGTYRGPGTYELTGERPTVEGLSSPLGDRVFLEITSLAPERVGLFRYAVFLEPCSLTVRDRLTQGRLRCPRLGAEEDEGEVSLTVRWEPR